MSVNGPLPPAPALTPGQVFAANNAHWAELDRVDGHVETLVNRTLEYATEELGSYEAAVESVERYLATLRTEGASR